MRYSDWSNLFYVLPFLCGLYFSLNLPSVIGFALAWMGLGLGSYMGHTRDSRFWWKVDVLTMFCAILSIGTGVLSQLLTPFVWLGLPVFLAAFFPIYRKARFKNKMEKTTGTFAFFSFSLLFYAGDVFALIPLVLFGIGLWFRLKESTSNHDVEHGHWHTASALAAAAAVVIIGIF